MIDAALQKRLTKLEGEVKILQSEKEGRAKLRAMILEGLNSGPGIPATPTYWKKKQALIKQLARHSK